MVVRIAYRDAGSEAVGVVGGGGLSIRFGYGSCIDLIEGLG